jgi:hypothetical protein
MLAQFGALPGHLRDAIDLDGLDTVRPEPSANGTSAPAARICSSPAMSASVPTSPNVIPAASRRSRQSFRSRCANCRSSSSISST